MNNSHQEGGFTLLELLVTIGIIGIIAALAIPTYFSLREQAQFASTVSDIKSIESAVVASFADNLSYPLNQSQGTFPPELSGFISSSIFTEPTPIGGVYDWEGPDRWGVAAVSIRGASLTNAQWTSLDRKLDDGNRNTGKFIRMGGTHFYIIDDSPPS